MGPLFTQTYSLIDEYPDIEAIAHVRSEVECGVLCESDMTCKHFYFKGDKEKHENCLLLIWMQDVAMGSNVRWSPCGDFLNKEASHRSHVKD